MRILHLCLSCFYIDGYNYQENVLPRINKQDGNDVEIIASTETFIDNQTYGYTEPGEYYTEYGVKIIRLPYRNLLTKTVTRKIRAYKGLSAEIEKFRPDIIFSHDLSFFSVNEVVKYVRNNPKVRFYADTHTSALNSGSSFLSLYVLHKIIYRSFIKQAIPFLKKYYYITEYEKNFSLLNYRVPIDIMEFFPLGGEIPNDDKYLLNRYNKRKELGVAQNEVLLLHSGKMNKEKRTDVLIKAFMKSKLQNAKLVIIGSISSEWVNEIETLMQQDSRVMFLGWKNSGELQEYLCAADLYCQPGSESATMENAVCCRCPVLVKKGSSYSYEEDYGNLIWIDSEDDIVEVLNDIEDTRINLVEMSEKSLLCASTILDYKVLANKYCK